MITNDGFSECIILYNALCTMHAGETMHCKPCYNESETKTSAVTWQHANYHSWNSVEVQCFPGFTRIKLSNTADWYMWNITDILPDESCVDMTYPDNMLAGLEGLNCHTDTMCSQTVRVFCIQSRRIDHKHGKILSDCQTRETLA